MFGSPTLYTRERKIAFLGTPYSNTVVREIVKQTRMTGENSVCVFYY